MREPGTQGSMNVYRCGDIGSMNFGCFLKQPDFTILCRVLGYSQGILLVYDIF